MIILGLTGGIASGKSTVLAMFARRGAAVYDADKAVHHLLTCDPAVAEAIAGAFPGFPAALPVDRKALGEIVFNDKERLNRLEAILHPRVRKMEKDFLRRATGEGRGLAVCDVPLLFETRAENRYDAVITVVSPRETQQRRALARPQMTEERYASILARQLPPHEKLKRTDFVVHTGLGRAYSMREVITIVKGISIHSPSPCGGVLGWGSNKLRNLAFLYPYPLPQEEGVSRGVLRKLGL